MSLIRGKKNNHVLNDYNKTEQKFSTLHNDTVLPRDTQQATKRSQRGTDAKIQREINYLQRANTERQLKDAKEQAFGSD